MCDDHGESADSKHVEFRSDRFPPYGGEEKPVNPEVSGKRVVGYFDVQV